MHYISQGSDREIQKMGQWRNSMFKEKILEQASAFTKEMSTNMRRCFNFAKFEGGVLQDSQTCVRKKELA